MPVLPIDTSLAHPDVRVGSVTYDPVELAPLADAVADCSLGEVVSVPLRESRLVSEPIVEFEEKGTERAHIDLPGYRFKFVCH